MGKSGRKNKGKEGASSSSTGDDDDALLEAAIAENSKQASREKAAAYEAAAAAAAKGIFGRYEAYKHATCTFLNWLALKEPNLVRTVRSILMAASNLRSKGVVLPTNIAQSLRNAIALRKEVHRLYGTGTQKPTLDDERHAHFIEALETAQAILSSIHPVEDQSIINRSILQGSGDTTHEAPLLSDGPEEFHAPKSAATAACAEADIIALCNRFDRLNDEEAPSKEAPDSEPAGTEKILALLGAAVVVQGVVSQPELNGLSAMVTGFDNSKGRYEVKIDGSGSMVRLKPANIRLRSMASAEEEKYVLGETIEFEAACLLLDLESVLNRIGSAWDDYARGRCSLLTAAALTNACVRHAERLASVAELQTRQLSSLEHVVCAAYMMHTISWVQSFLSVPLNTALMLVSDITHGIPGDTVLPTLGGERVLHGVRIHSMLLSQGMRLPHPERAAAAQALEKLREHIRSYPRCTGEQIEALLRRVTEDAADRLGGLDFYVGSNGLLLTASFLRILASPKLNIVKRPKVWSAPKPGFFGPMWDEEHNPATCTNDLTDYLGGVLPALLSFADGEMLSMSGGKATFPELKMKELMPLWSILEGAMDKKAATLSLTIALQAVLLSVVRVNGDGRCMGVQRTTRAAFTKAFEQIDRDYHAFTETAKTGDTNSDINRNNLAMMWSYLEFSNRRHTSTPFSQLEAFSVRQRDQSLLQNPWVAGQQLLVLSVGVGIGCGSTILDSLGQTSFALHLQNALRVAGAAQPVPLLDDTFMHFLGGENKAVWFAGVPRANFMKAWYHRMGMDATTKTNRKLVAIEAVDLSPAYRCTAADDLSSLPIAESTNPLPIVLDAIGSAFASDQMIGLNLAALGAKLAALPERLVDSLGLRAHFERELSEQLHSVQHNSGKARGKGGVEHAAANEKHRRAAMHTTLVSALFSLCEREVPDQSEPFHTGEHKFRSAEGRDCGRKELPPCTPAERGMLERAGTVVKDFVESIQTTDYKIPLSRSQLSTGGR